MPSNDLTIDWPPALLERNRQEKDIVRQLGDWMGYGRIMQLAEEIWREKAAAQGLHGSEHTTGPCGAFMVPCPHPVKDNMGHCDICCGAGRITQGVLAMSQQVAACQWQPIETAPKDASFLALTSCGARKRICVLRYSPPEDEGGNSHSYRSPDGAWYGKDTVTHWMPLPEPPVNHGQSNEYPAKEGS